MKTDKIYLVGFMGAGKSTVARALGTSLGWQVEDIDDAIVARERQSIADIFARRGEAYFREIESTVLLSLLPLRHAIVATGGGTFVEPENRRVINDDGASIWLDLAFEQVVARIPSDGRRPLAVDRGHAAGAVPRPPRRLSARPPASRRRRDPPRRARRTHSRLARLLTPHRAVEETGADPGCARPTGVTTGVTSHDRRAGHRPVCFSPDQPRLTVTRRNGNDKVAPRQ